MSFIDSIVLQPKHAERVVSKYKVKEYHMELIKELVIQNERQRTLNHKYAKNSLQLYEDFLRRNDEFREDVFSYYTFYNIVRDIKKSLAEY